MEVIDCLVSLHNDLFKGIAMVDKSSAELESNFANLHGAYGAIDVADKYRSPVSNDRIPYIGNYWK